jgi:hypothetical protein
MFPINPLSGALIQSAQVQLQQAAERTQQARKAEQTKKNVAARENDEDEVDHQVENSEELSAIHDENSSAEQKRKQRQHEATQDQSDDDNSDGLDLKA